MLSEQARFGLAPERRGRKRAGDRAGMRGLLPAAAVGEQQLDRGPGMLVGVGAAGEQRRIGTLARACGEDAVDGRDQRGGGAEVAGHDERGSRGLQRGAARAEQLDVGVAKAVDGLQLVADGEEVVALDQLQ